MAQEIPVNVAAANITGMGFSKDLALLVGEGSAKDREFGVAHIHKNDVFGSGRKLLSAENTVRERERGSLGK